MTVPAGMLSTKPTNHADYKKNRKLKVFHADQSFLDQIKVIVK